MQQPFRIQPLGPANAYVTYQIKAGRDTSVVAACKDVGCRYWREGWESTFDESTDLGRTQAAYVRDRGPNGAGRDYTEHRTAAGLTVFRFAPYQRCFTEHRTSPDVFVRRDGDWRGNPTGRRLVHSRPQDWVEDFQEHEGSLADLRQKG